MIAHYYFLSPGNWLRLFSVITEHRSMNYGQMVECRTHSIITGNLDSAIAGISTKSESIVRAACLVEPISTDSSERNKRRMGVVVISTEGFFI